MANSTTTDINVDLVANARGVDKSVNDMLASLGKIEAKVQSIFKAAEKSAKEVSKMMANLDTYNKLGTQPANNIKQRQMLSGTANTGINVEKFTRDVGRSTTALQALEARISGIKRQAANLARNGNLLPPVKVAELDRLKAYQAELNKILTTEKRIADQRRQSGATGKSGSAGALAELDSAMLNNRRRVFDKELNAAKDAQARELANLRSVASDNSLRGRISLGERTDRAVGKVGILAANNPEKLLAAQAVSAGKIATLRAQAAKASGEELRNIQQSLSVENARSGAIQKHINAQPRAAESKLGNILSPKYMAAAAARTAVYGAAAGGVYALYSALQAGVGWVVEFDQALADLQAIAGATEGQMSTLTDQILEVGSTSKFSTVDLTKAATTLAQAGFSTQEIGVSLKAVSDLAAGTGSTMAESVDLVTAAVGAFQLQASEAERIADALMGALNKSRLNVGQAASAVQYVGATAFEQGISMEEVLAAAGTASNAGIKSGSTIGTGMRQLLVDLQEPSKKLVEQLSAVGLTMADIDVKTKGLRGTLETLRDAGFGASQAYGGLETRAAASYLTLKNNLDVMDEIIQAELLQGQASAAATTATNTLHGEWQRFKNLLAEAFNDPLQDIADSMKEMLEWINWIIEGYNTFKAAADGLSDSFYAWVDGNEYLKDYAGVLEWVIERNGEASDGVAEATEALSTQNQTVDSLTNAMNNLWLKQGVLTDGSSALATETQILASRFPGLSANIAGTTNTFMGLIQAMRMTREEAIATQYVLAQTAHNKQKLALVESASKYKKNANSLTSWWNIGSGSKAELGAMNSAKDFHSAVMGANRVRVSADKRLKAGTIGKAEYNSIMGQVSDFSEMWGNSATVSGTGRLLKTLGVRTTPQWSKNQGAVEAVGGAMGVFQGNQARLDPKRRQAEKADIVQTTNAIRQNLANQIAASNDPTTKAELGAQLNEANSLLTSFVAGSEEGATKKEKRSGGRAERALKRRAGGGRQNSRNEKNLARMYLEAAQDDLEDAIKDNSEPIDLGSFKEGIGEIDLMFKSWVEAKNAAVAEEIKSGEMTGAQAERAKEVLARDIQNKKEDVARSMSDAIVKMVDNLLEAAEDAMDKAMHPLELKIAGIEGNLQSFDRFGGRYTPDFVRSNMEHQQKLAEEQRDRARLVELEKKRNLEQDSILDLKRAQSFVSEWMSKGINLKGETAKGPESYNSSDAIVVTGTLQKLGLSLDNLSDDSVQKIVEKMRELEKSARDGTLTIETLRNSLTPEIHMPQSWGEAASQAAAAYSRDNGLDMSDMEFGMSKMSSVLGETHEALNSFFTDLLTKPQAILSTFRNFVSGMISMLLKLAAQWAAMQVLKMVLGAVGGGSVTPGSTDIGSGTLDSLVGGVTGNYKGGIVGYATGGLVNHGVPNRDSVLTGLARGEFVVRKSAVDNVGRGFMEDLNKRGQSALSGLGGTTVVGAGARQEQNIYLIAPQEQPQMGPNDVLLTIHRDILKDGATKRLIKQVAQGG